MGQIPNRRIVKLAGLPVLAGLAALPLVLAVPAPSSAQRIENAVAVFAALDKVMVLHNGIISEFGPIDRVMPRIAPGFPLKRIVGR